MTKYLEWKGYFPLSTMIVEDKWCVGQMMWRTNDVKDKWYEERMMWRTNDVKDEWCEGRMIEG